MQALIHNFGLDWKLFLAQAINFFVVLVVLRFTIYKPLLAFLAERRDKIAEGVAKSAEADQKLHEAHEVKKVKTREAEAEIVNMMKSAEARAEGEMQKIMDAAARKEADMMKAALERMEAEKTEERKKLYDEAVELVKKTIIKTVDMNPAAIDEKLIEKIMKEQIAV